MLFKIEEGSHEDIYLYPQWGLLEYNIIYDSEMMDGATCPDGGCPTNYSIESTFPISIGNPTKPGYEFLGWCSGLDNETCDEPAIDLTILKPQDDMDDIYLYPQWEALEFTISLWSEFFYDKFTVNYQCEVGDTVLSETVAFDSQYSFKENTSRNGTLCEKTGFEYQGWICNKAGDSTVSVPVEDIDNWNMLYNVNCVADWQGTQFMVSFYYFLF